MKDYPHKWQKKIKACLIPSISISQKKVGENADHLPVGEGGDTFDLFVYLNKKHINSGSKNKGKKT
jgi:hypothetical protein